MEKITLNQAKGIFDKTSQKVTIKTGSILTIDPYAKGIANNIQQNYDTAAEALQAGKLRKKSAGVYEVVEDIPGLSPSGAGVIVTGKPVSGWKKWKLENGQFLDVLRSNKRNATPKSTVHKTIETPPPAKASHPMRSTKPLSKSSCCQVPPGPHGNFLCSLQHDAAQFSQYVGNGNPAGLLAFSRFQTSGLHFEMKLWCPRGPLPKRYRPNDAQHNSWWAMANRTIAPAEIHPCFTPVEKTDVFGGLCADFPINRNGCAQLEYDRWILKQIMKLRATGLNHAGIDNVWNPVHGNSKPPELGTVGLAQKLINIFVKYQFCWQRVGQWGANGFLAYTPPFDLNNFLCALHAPIDRMILRSLNCYALGKYLEHCGMLEGENLIQSSDGINRPWSKLDCLRTYYGFQLIFRRVAMKGWPSGCGCSDSTNLTNHCSEIFEREFANGEECRGYDWIQVARELPDEVIDETLRQLEQNEAYEKNVKGEVSK